MESVNQIMGRLGFNKDADESTKAAFVKNLIKQAYGVEVRTPSQYQTSAGPRTLEELNRHTIEGKSLPQIKTEAKQLSFDLSEVAPKVG